MTRDYALGQHDACLYRCLYFYRLYDSALGHKGHLMVANHARACMEYWAGIVTSLENS